MLFFVYNINMIHTLTAQEKTKYNTNASYWVSSSDYSFDYLEEIGYDGFESVYSGEEEIILMD